MSRQYWLLIFALLLAVTISGCQSAEPETVEVTVEVTRVVEIPAEAPKPEIVEVTRVVEVPAEAPEPEIVKVTRVVELQSEQTVPESPSLNPMMPVELDRIESSATGREYALTVALPLSYMMTDLEYPVIYVTDGDFYAVPLAVAAGQLAFGQEIPEFIVVGVDYGTPNPMEWLELRELDLAPAGQAAFLRFFEEELIPYVESNYRAASTNRTLAGHSLGGFFTLYGLLNAADTFSNFIASSPGGAEGLVESVENYPANAGESPTRLYMSVGDLDEATLTSVQAFSDALDEIGFEGLLYETSILDNETHLSARPRAFNNGLRWLYGQGSE